LARGRSKADCPAAHSYALQAKGALPALEAAVAAAAAAAVAPVPKLAGPLQEAAGLAQAGPLKNRNHARA